MIHHGLEKTLIGTSCGAITRIVKEENAIIYNEKVKKLKNHRSQRS